MEEQIIWYDGHGHKHRTAVLAKHTHTFELGDQNLKRSWVATWHPRFQMPVWIDIREIEEFV